MWWCVLLSFSLSQLGQGLEQTLLPGGVFRDDVLFELTWPGTPPELEEVATPPTKHQPSITHDYDSQLSPSDEAGIGELREEGVKEETDVRVFEGALLPEADYEGLNFVDMRTGGSEEYRCVLPQILSGDFNKVGVACGWSQS